MPGKTMHPVVLRFALPLLGAAVAIAACTKERSARDSVVQAGTPPAGAHFDLAAWQPPPESAIPADSLGASIRRGLALVMHTADSLPAYAPGRLNCTNCHINGGRNADAAPLAGSQARFPKYMDRTGAVIGLADRVNYCFTRSLAGNKLPVESREMEDILAYIAWLSSGVPVGEGKKLAGAEGLHTMTALLTGDRARGATVFAAKCVACHGPDGQGNPNIPPGVPPLWGPKSFSVGASMARQGKAASFIWHNMPYGAGKTLTQQEAFDVASYITSKPRPDSPGKEGDWPAGGTPGDVPYATKGHAAYQPPPLLPRANPRDAIVASPVPTKRTNAERGR
jgi:thiosulfate dehydrogenase